MVSTTKTYPKDLQALLETLPDLSPNDRGIIERAYHRAEAAHEGQKRKSGEPYFTHCVAVAGILADMKLDSEAIAAGLLHDVIEDTPVTREDLRAEFGSAIAQLVDGVTKLDKLPMKPIGQNADNNRHTGTVNREMEYFRKMLLTMDADVRVVLVKLADRLHNMRTLGYMPEAKQKRIARETLDIFAPLANRLGIWQIKWELEDLSFRYLNPDAYRAIARSLDERRTDREDYVAHAADRLRQELDENDIQDVLITARPKHIYSIYKKMNRKDLPLEQIYDIRAMRVIVNKRHQCYTVLGIVHELWRPIPDEFDDYIASPKDNFYRSLHTAVIDENGKTIEVQIRTWDMHEDAEYGIAAHWRYKEGRRSGKDQAFEERIAYLRRLMEYGPGVREEDAETFMSRVKSEVFEDRVFVFTPQGDAIDLPVGATPIDFAYHVHTEIGHRCRGAKVHGKLVRLDYQLKTGDQVEIITAKRGGPSMDWLNSDLGYVKTSRARSKIRHWFRHQNRDKHVAMGRETLERDLKRLSLVDRIGFHDVAMLLDYDKLDNFLAAIGSGDITSAQITQRILEEENRKREARKTEVERFKPRPSSIRTDASNGVQVMGSGGLMTNLARCCNPAPGDTIIGYVTRGRGVTVHRTDCPNVAAINDTERLVDVNWGSIADEQTYIVPVEILAQDREGLLRDLTMIIADENINITEVSVVTRQQIATLYVSLEILNNSQLARILNKITTIPNVYEARRVNPS
jgi:GTP diphosphokinase / guanosine-3',5'-bis(diphosphate) 3'-diphosphatase